MHRLSRLELAISIGRISQCQGSPFFFNLQRKGEHHHHHPPCWPQPPHATAMLTTRPRDGGEREPAHGFDGSVHVGVAPPMDDAQLNAVDPVTSTTATSKKRQHPPVCNALDSSDFASSNDGAKRLKVDTALAASAIEPKPTEDSTVATTPASASLVKAVAEDHMTKVPATVSKSNGAQTAAAVATAPASASSRAAVTVHAPCTPTSSGPDKHRISRYVVYGSYSQLMTEEERKAAPKDHTHKWKVRVKLMVVVAPW